MGNNAHTAGNTYSNFQMQKYLNQGLTQAQIMQVREAFESYHPVDGKIDLASLRICTEQSMNKDKIDSLLGGKTTMNFDEFFAMSRELLQE